MILSLNRTASTNIRSGHWKSRRLRGIDGAACSYCKRPVEVGETFYYRQHYNPKAGHRTTEVAGLCCQFETYEG